MKLRWAHQVCQAETTVEEQPPRRAACIPEMRLLSLQVQKRNFIENIIPIIISLKTVLEKNKVPALRELMNYLRVRLPVLVAGLPPQLIARAAVLSGLLTE